MFHAIYMVCLFFLLIKLLWDVKESHDFLSRVAEQANRFTSDKFNFKVIDRADSDSDSDSDSDDDDDADKTMTRRRHRRRIVECDGEEDLKALEKKTRELQERVKTTLTTASN